MPPTVLRAFHLRESKYLPSARHPAPELFELIADVKRRASFRGEFFVTMELERTVEDAAERAAELRVVTRTSMLAGLMRPAACNHRFPTHAAHTRSIYHLLSLRAMG